MEPADRAPAAAATVPASAEPRADAPAFSEPWQARAFAITLLLHELGLFTWSEWTGRLGHELAAVPDGGSVAPDGADPGPYHRAWLAALQALLAERGVVAEDLLADVAEAWQAAAHATPHGQPIRLENARGSRRPDA